MAESTEATMQNTVMMENDFRKAFAVNTGVGEVVEEVSDDSVTKEELIKATIAMEEEFDRRIEEDVVLFQANGLSESDLSRGLFIVVSLKQGMFNNANVLFRTKFVDGVSTVQRTIAKQSK
ncbi:hypothetical protein LWI28_022156 [Acer negundo]|uniref:Uncharacterized protein n=1 Tax=Acer negundo TaxID=4023 RepID=A0AAD5NJI5_ACENE|nr:hypothetical protein LWI28_022156 [Acer negundo]